MASDRQPREALERFYTLIDRLKSIPGQGQPLGVYGGMRRWPTRGVYFFFEPSELRGSDPTLPRVVRVGTHAVSRGSKSTLWKRLRQHLGTRDGGGNHRGSVFRRHVGAALLSGDPTAYPHWGLEQSASRDVRTAEAPHERRVTAYIGAMSVVWVAVPDPPSKTSERGLIERSAISLLSTAGRLVDPRSHGWLGHRSRAAAIRESGLWNVNYVGGEGEPGFLDTFERAVELTEKG